MKFVMLVIFMFLITSCTYTKITLADGTSATYLDVHPGGNAVKARAVWDGVGSFDVDRDTADSAKTIKDLTL